MDILFHAASGALLASALGEEHRAPYLIAGAVLGAAPDLIWGTSTLLRAGDLVYPLSHSLILGGAVCLAVMLVNWRIAFGWPMHLLVDLPLHKDSLLYRQLHATGINWYQGWGLAIAAALWVLLLALAAIHLRHRRRSASLARQSA